MVRFHTGHCNLLVWLDLTNIRHCGLDCSSICASEREVRVGRKCMSGGNEEMGGAWADTYTMDRELM